MTQRPYLNLGCGRITLPGERPAHHGLVDEAIYDYPLWLNVDRNAGPGVDECVDIFTYPWPWTDNSFDEALLGHIAEHIPHEIRLQYVSTANENEFLPKRHVVKRSQELQQMQDGWYAFFAELYRVLTDGAMVHILSPYAWSAGAVTDPTHTRLLTEHTFTHSMKPEPHNTFEYANGGIHFEMEGVVFHPTGLFPHDDQQEFARALQTRLNVVYEFYVKLRVVKDAKLSPD